MDWFLYDNGLRHERVKEKKQSDYPKLQVVAIFSLTSIEMCDSSPDPFTEQSEHTQAIQDIV